MLYGQRHKKEALLYHEIPSPGKRQVVPTKKYGGCYIYTDKCRETADYSGVKTIGTDETAMTGHNYITTFVVIDQKRTLFVTQGKDNTTVEKFASDLELHGGLVQNITQASCDMSPAFVKAINKNLPNAEITFTVFM